MATDENEEVEGGLGDGFAEAFQEEDWAGSPESADEQLSEALEEESGEAEEQEAESAESEGEASGEGSEQQADSGESGKKDLQDLLSEAEKDYPDLVQRVRSWEGRLSAKDKELQDLKNRMQNVEADTPSSGTGQQSGQQPQGEAEASQSTGPDDQATGETELSQRFREEWGDELADFLEQRAREIADERVKSEVDSRLSPLEQAQAEAQQASHEQMLDQQHPDWRDIASSDDLVVWIDEQPGYLAETYKRVAQEGTTEEVLDLLSRYKSERGVSNEQPQQEAAEETNNQTSTRQKKATQGAAVKGRSAGPPKGGGNDFESAFNEF